MFGHNTFSTVVGFHSDGSTKEAETFAATTSDGYPTNAPTGYTGSYYTITSNPYGKESGSNLFIVWKPDGTKHSQKSRLLYAKQSVSSAPGYYWKDMTDEQKKKVARRKAKAAKEAMKKWKKKKGWWAESEFNAVEDQAYNTLKSILFIGVGVWIGRNWGN
jgi:hypothetical protein